MKKRILATSLLLGMVAVSANASNLAEVNTTSKALPAETECAQAGSISFSFDDGTTLVDGDEILMKLDYINTDNNVKLCKDVDLFVSPNAMTGVDTFVGYGPAELANGTGVSAHLNGDAAATATGTVGFKVYGQENFNSLTLSVVGAADGDNIAIAAGVSGVTEELLTLSLFDEKVGEVWVQGDDEGEYDVAGTAADNTICVDVSAFGDAYVHFSLDSDDAVTGEPKFTFTPVNPQIADIGPEEDYAVVECKDSATGLYPIGLDTSQGSGDTCDEINNTMNDEFCYTGVGEEGHYNNNLIIEAEKGEFATTASAFVTYEILVNGKDGDNGVYFNSESMSASQGKGVEDDCDLENSTSITMGQGTVYDADDEAIASADVGALDPDDTTDCTVAPDSKGVKYVSSTFAMDSANGEFLYLDLPDMYYDLDSIDAGDVVSVKVTLGDGACDELAVVEQEITTFTEECPALGESGQASFPYFTDVNDSFWDGIAISETSGVGGEVTLTMFEADGDVAVATVPVTARGMYCNTLSAMVAAGEFVLDASAAGDGIIGNTRSQIEATSETVTFSGFAMMADDATGASMGYLAEQPQVIIAP